MEIKEINPEKAVKKFDPDVVKVRDLTQKEPTPEELLFKETYLSCGNATATYMKVFPEKCKMLKPVDIRARASHLVKKFMIKGRTAKKIRTANNNARANASADLVGYVKKQYELGLLSEEELYARMDELSKKSTSDQTKFNATKEMRQWVREAKSEIEANQLSKLTVVQLMIDALSDLPRIKYVEVLRGVKKTRVAMNKERGIVYNPDEIREKQRQDIMFRGAPRRGFEI
jgi:hypothetical protein